MASEVLDLFILCFCYTDVMTNVNPVPPQSSFNSSSMPNIQLPVVNNSTPIAKEEPNINKNKSIGSSSNKLWIILLVLLAMIIGFWIGYFTQEYFNQNNVKQNDLVGRVNQPTPIIQPTVEPVIQPTTAPAAINKEYIFFKGDLNYLNDGLNFVSQEQCVEDEIAKLIAIEDDSLTIQVNQWTLEEETGEYLPELIDFQVQDQECIMVRPICPNVSVERCFSLENIDGVYHLDYEFREEGTMPPATDLESEL